MIRVLFVDDEVNVLQALQRSLHHMRREWSMEFVLSGIAALDAMAHMPADVIVSDMRMPGMDGWELLARIKVLHPLTVRLILSGHADPISIMRSVGTAHQYLSKPCECAELKAAIARTDALRQMLNNDRLAQLVGHVGNLQSAPQAFQKILTCLQQPSASLVDAARIISRDAAMTANVMKLVNSAFFGAPPAIKTVDKAVAYLGLETLCSLVLGHSIFNSAAVSAPRQATLERLMRHSLDTALTARLLARCEKLGSAFGEQAFLAAMLHDVGRLVIAMQPVATPADGDAWRAGELQMDEHHAEIGAYLLGLWAFPSPVVEAVAFHHSPASTVQRGLSLTRLVHIADVLSHQRNSHPSDSAGHQFEPGLLAEIGLEHRLPDWFAALDALESGSVAS